MGDSELPVHTAYERYASALQRYLIRRVRCPEDVKDLTQQIFELFVKRKERPEVIRNPRAYLFRIAFHVVSGALADGARNPVTFDSERVPDSGSENIHRSSHEEAEELIALKDVRSALQQLPEQHLRALMLVAGQGMSYKEAAKVSGFTPSTIATYVMHGRAALSLALDGHRVAKKTRRPGAAQSSSVCKVD